MVRVKLQFSKEESVLLTDPAFILTKNRILARISEMMGAVSDEEVKIAGLLREQLPPEVFQFPPKLSRGEQYQQLPWLMLHFSQSFPGTRSIGDPAVLLVGETVFFNAGG